MSIIKRRIEKLERTDHAGQCRFVWIEAGETEEQALARAGAERPILATDKVIIVGWASS